MSLEACSAEGDQSLEIGFAGHRFLVQGLTGFHSQALRSYFATELVTGSSTTAIEIEVDYRSNGVFTRRPLGPTEYAVSLEHERRELRLSGIGFAATIERGSLRTTMATNLDELWFPGGFENVLRAITSYRLFLDGGLVLHSAAFVNGGTGFLFCGRSGAGKSTLCGLARQLGLEVISDELNALVPEGDGLWSLQAMPFAGSFRTTRSDWAPCKLSGLFGIEKGTQSTLVGCSKAEAVSRIIAACPYINCDPMLSEALTDRAEQIVGQLSFQILSFTKDLSFWSVLTDEYHDGRTALPP